jgi:hypothetical protein
MMLRCSLTLSLAANLLFAELPAQIRFTPLTRQQNTLETKQIFMCEERDYLRVAQSRNYMVKLHSDNALFFLYHVLDLSLVGYGCKCVKGGNQMVTPSQQDCKDIEGLLLLNFTSHNNIMSANWQKLHATIKNKCQDKLTDILILLHDNVHIHVAHIVQDQLRTLKWEVLLTFCLQSRLIAM